MKFENQNFEQQQLNVGVLRKMCEQLTEVMQKFSDSPPPNMSLASRQTVLRDMQAQYKALDFAYTQLTEKFGEPPVVSNTNRN